MVPYWAQPVIKSGLKLASRMIKVNGTVSLERSCIGLAWTSAMPLFCAITCSTGSEPAIEILPPAAVCPLPASKGRIFCPKRYLLSAGNSLT